MAKEHTSMRLEPEIVSLLRKIAKEEYGKESKIGYVVENAITLYQAHRTRPIEAQALLSVAEERLIDRMDKRINDMNKNIVERIGSLFAKNTYESCLTSLLVEDLHTKAGFHKGIYENKRKDAASRMRKRLETEGAKEAAGVIEENQELIRTNQALESQLSQVAETFNQLKNEFERLETENQSLAAENKAKDHNHQLLKQWTNGLALYLKENQSVMKKNAALIEEYTRLHPVPKG